MSVHAYKSLDDDGLELLESDQELAALYLDFLTVLHDIINRKVTMVEPSVYDPKYQEDRSFQLADALPDEHQIRATAKLNRERALSLLSTREGDTLQFLQLMLREYNVVRLQRSRDKVPI